MTGMQSDSNVVNLGRRVVVGIDGTRGSRQALQRALEVFGDDIDLTVVNVVGVNAFAAERRAQSRLLTNTTERLGATGITVNALARQGDPADILVEVAADFDASALVVGSRGAYVYVAGRDDEARLGSVCLDVIARAACDVLVVKEKVGG